LLLTRRDKTFEILTRQEESADLHAIVLSGDFAFIFGCVVSANS